MSRNFTMAFQIAAAFTGNKAFTDAATKLASINAKISEVTRTQINLTSKVFSHTITQSEYNKKMAECSSVYDKLIKKQKLYFGLSNVQNKYESSFANMSKYGVNFMQFKSLGQGIYDFADKAQQFEGAMSKVQAITKSSKEEMKLLEEQAIELGSKTKFSASESAAAMSYLGMAGWKTEQILKAMPGLLDLAAASGEELATVSDIISDDLTAFGMSADKARHMADVFAAASSNANTNVSMMGETFKYAGSVAGALGYKLEDVALATGLMANASIKGSQAGTSLRSIFTRLAKPTKEVVQGLGAIGLKAENLAGQPLDKVIEEFRKKFQGLTKDQKAQAAAQIAGQEAMSGLLAIVNASEADYDKLREAVNNCNGEAKRMADTMSNNTEGKVISFKSALESLQISIGKNLLPTIATTITGFTEMVNAVGKFTKEYPTLTSNTIGAAVALTGFAMASNAAMWILNALKSVVYGTVAAYKFATVALVENQVAHKAWTLAKLLSITVMQTGNNVLLAMAGKIKWATVWSRSLTVAQWALNSAMLASPVGVAVIGIVALGAAVTFLWNNVDWLRVKWTLFWNDFSVSHPNIAKGFELIWLAITGPYKLLCAFINKFKELIGLGPSAAEKFSQHTAISNNPNDYEHNATGGIYGRGAFLTTFAEDSGESAIPHTPNAHNIGLLAKTNEIMGNPLGGNNISVNFAPVINASGSADAAAIQNVIADERRKLESMLNDLMNQQRRLSYA